MTGAEQISRENLLAKVPCGRADCALGWVDDGASVLFRHALGDEEEQVKVVDPYEAGGNVRAGWLSEAMDWLTEQHN